MLAGIFKISSKEKLRREEMRQALRPGLLLEFINTDYHEEGETPPGFMVFGDWVKLIRIVGTRPIVDGKTREQVDSYNVWETETHWGRSERDEYYLAAMTKVKNE